MSKYIAILNKDNYVLNIIVVNDDYEPNINEIIYTDTNPAYINGDYFEGYFYPPQPYPSWIRNNGDWQAPTPRPNEGLWVWDEENLMWQQLEN